MAKEKKIVVRYSKEEPDEDDDRSNIFRLLTKKKKKHKYKIQSVTRFELDGTAPCETITVVTVWRNENDLGPYHLTNLDLYDAVKDKVHHSDYKLIAETLIALDRVAIAEAVDYSSGSGIRLEKED